MVDSKKGGGLKRKTSEPSIDAPPTMESLSASIKAEDKMRITQKPFNEFLEDMERASGQRPDATDAVLAQKREQELASSSTKKLNELTVKLKSAIDEADHCKDMAAKVDIETMVHKAEVNHHKVIRKQHESSLELVNKELEREKAEHAASVAPLEREDGLDGELPFDLNKFLAAEKEAEEDSDLPDEVALSSVPSPPPETSGPSETNPSYANLSSEAPNAL
ncbi:hypothetical protein OWV82_012042 [Melia azedarach]|uniref:Uncharacterized protein n=1 Tax=Melia azedarach TaxID=155640 RepID=A0ACC1Y1P8_MELAZ|nr:hypothetical protein OWV82_012042 [Melia azedarach]